MNNAFPFIAGIAFTLINVRVGMGFSEKQPERPSQISTGMFMAPNPSLDDSTSASKDSHVIHIPQTHGGKASMGSEVYMADGSGSQDSCV